MIINIGPKLNVNLSHLDLYKNGGLDKRNVVNSLMNLGMTAVEELIVNSNKIEYFNYSILATDLLISEVYKKNLQENTRAELKNKIALRKSITEYISQECVENTRLFSQLQELNGMTIESDVTIRELE